MNNTCDETYEMQEKAIGTYLLICLFVLTFTGGVAFGWQVCTASWEEWCIRQGYAHQKDSEPETLIWREVEDKSNE